MTRGGSGNRRTWSLKASDIDLRAFDLEGNIDARDKSYLNLRNGAVKAAGGGAQGDILLRRDSDIVFSDTDGPVMVEGNLICEDDDSRATLAAGTVIGGTDCLGFMKTTP